MIGTVEVRRDKLPASIHGSQYLPRVVALARSAKHETRRTRCDALRAPLLLGPAAHDVRLFATSRCFGIVLVHSNQGLGGTVSYIDGNLLPGEQVVFRT